MPSWDCCLTLTQRSYPDLLALHPLLAAVCINSLHPDEGYKAGTSPRVHPTVRSNSHRSHLPPYRYHLITTKHHFDGPLPRSTMSAKNGFTTCLWFVGQAEDAAKHYTSLFKNSKNNSFH